LIALTRLLEVPDLAADFAARGRSRMNVRVGGSVEQSALEFVEPAGGNLLCGQAYSGCLNA